MQSLLALSLTSSLVACAAAPALDDTADTEAETAAITAAGKADATGVALGLYASRATHHYDGDLPSLELRADGNYVRTRCYRASCALATPQTDTFDTYRSSSGKTYVRFHAWKADHDAAGNLVQTPVVADVYEIRATAHGIDLRKSFASRWQALYTTTTAHTCTATGGTVQASDCACPGNPAGVFPTQSFAPGAGGCIARVPDNESNCDDSNGAWHDDDADLVGAYCTCGVDRYVDATGACAAAE